MGGEETQPPAVTGFCEYRDLQIEQGFERSQAENGNRGSPPDAVTRNACDPKRAAIKETLYTQTSCTPVSQRVMSLPPSSPPIMALPGSRPLYIAPPRPPASKSSHQTAGPRPTVVRARITSPRTVPTDALAASSPVRAAHLLIRRAGRSRECAQQDRWSRPETRSCGRLAGLWDAPFIATENQDTPPSVTRICSVLDHAWRSTPRGAAQTTYGDPSATP